MATKGDHLNKLPIVDYRVKLPDHSCFMKDIFPHDTIGKFLQGTVRIYLFKSCQRTGWLRKGACSDPGPYPNESVASHSWGIGYLIMCITKLEDFRIELPVFDVARAIEMALIHDVPETITGDITPVDGVDPTTKHKIEERAMEELLAPYNNEISQFLRNTYKAYEDRQTDESKLVKDCDKLDFILTAFVLERQGFIGFSEFYDNSCSGGFYFKITKTIADVLVETRKNLVQSNCLYIANS